MGVAAIPFVAWQAFRRRSLALALIAVGFFVMWLPWVRIDRATFQYHYYTALIFVLLAVAYLFAELWHGPSRRTWLMARVAAAIAVMGPALLWLFRLPALRRRRREQGVPELAGVQRDRRRARGDPADRRDRAGPRRRRRAHRLGGDRAGA